MQALPSKRICFFLTAFIVVWLSGDTVIYFYLRKLQTYRNIFYGMQIPDASAIEHLKKTFHPDWGWDISDSAKGTLGSRKGRSYPSKPLYKIKAFGDSYTYGVTPDKQTWCYLLEEMTGWECLNYGVGGYGPDQALQKYKGIPLRSEYVILGILDENIGRIMTHWWGFYHAGGMAVKPKYAFQNGCLFIPAPIGKADDLHLLGNMDFLHELQKNDYWQRYYEKSRAPQKLRWPATLTVMKNFRFFSRHIRLLFKNYFFPSYESMTASMKFYHLYDNESDAIKITECIIDEFVHIASQRGERPVILLFPIKHTVDMLARFGKKPYRIVTARLEEKRIPFIDFGEVFIKENYREYYNRSGGHLSAEGNARVARELIHFISRDGALQ